MREKSQKPIVDRSQEGYGNRDNSESSRDRPHRMGVEVQRIETAAEMKRETAS